MDYERFLVAGTSSLAQHAPFVNLVFLARVIRLKQDLP